MGVLRTFRELQNIWDMPSFVHQKSRWLTIYLKIVDIFFKYSKQYNWNVVEDDIKLKVVWLKKKGFFTNDTIDNGWK